MGDKESRVELFPVHRGSEIPGLIFPYKSGNLAPDTLALKEYIKTKKIKEKKKEKETEQHEKLCSCSFSAAPFSVITNSYLSHSYIKSSCAAVCTLSRV